MTSCHSHTTAEVKWKERDGGTNVMITYDAIKMVVLTQMGSAVNLRLDSPLFYQIVVNM